ncbi:MAG: redoxin domain-containing protein [Gammaproteobacteria bacterium]|nr:redoxin domain-containing protein [Gammaproteobacteria bacterium]
MMDNLAWIIGAAVILLVASAWYFLKKKGGPRTPKLLRPGRSLPDFAAVDEQGQPVRSSQLIGAPAVMLFVRGNWCPFCTSQVEDLTKYYKAIINLGARLIFVTPKPLETTRRVAEFFKVEFDFWLDDQLIAARQLGLLMPASVPGDHQQEYGADTLWPMALVIDAAGTIRYSKLSRFIVDRPDPKVLVNALKRM